MAELPLDLRLAGPADVDVVLELLTEAARWVRARTGIEQWPDRFPREFISALVDSGTVYVALDDGQIVATLCVQRSDAIFWPDADTTDAVYVHRLAVRRTHAGGGIGKRLLGWAEHRAAEAGRRFVRLDCMTENTRLRRYYESLGFRHQGDFSGVNPPMDVAFRARWHSSLYERAVSPVASGELHPGVTLLI